MPYDRDLIHKGAFLTGDAHAATTAPALPPGMSMTPEQIAQVKTFQKEMRAHLRDVQHLLRMKKILDDCYL